MRKHIGYRILEGPSKSSMKLVYCFFLFSSFVILKSPAISKHVVFHVERCISCFRDLSFANDRNLISTSLMKIVFPLCDGSGVDLVTRMTEFQDADAVERPHCVLDFPLCWAHSFPSNRTFPTLVQECLRGLGNSCRQLKSQEKESCPFHFSLWM